MIREAQEHNLAEVATLLPEFCAASRFVEGTPDVFVTAWRGILSRGVGAIFMLVDDDGKVQGAIGGLVFPDPFSGLLIATEAFWFVRARHRKTVGSMRLYKAFEQWARARGCRRIQMIHLADVNPEEVAAMYRRMGFELAEMRYVKELAA